MKRFISVSMAITFITLILLMPVGCKFNAEAFSVTGTWEVEQLRTYEDGKTESTTVSYVFKGNKYAGSVISVNPVGVFSGNYQVSGNQITFSYTTGRAIIFLSTHYTGEIYPDVGIIKGTLTGGIYEVGELEMSWTGEFLAKKLED